MTSERHLASAYDIQRRNREIDQRLLEVIATVPEAHLHDEFDGRRWTLAEQLGHLGEFPAYFARQLDEWMRGERAVIGRNADMDPDRTDALVRATVRRQAGMVADIEWALRQLDDVLGRMTDNHLLAHAHDVTIGRQSMTWFIDTYVIRHKERHLRDLRQTLASL
jgi:uncharacterized damage-inducible protein DinB